MIIRPYLFTILSVGYKDEILSDFASIGYEKTQLSYMHPLHLMWFLLHMHIFISPLMGWVHTFVNECLLSCYFSLHWLWNPLKENRKEIIFFMQLFHCCTYDLLREGERGRNLFWQVKTCFYFVVCVMETHSYLLLKSELQAT